LNYCIVKTGLKKVAGPPATADQGTYLFHLNSPHGAADIDDKEDVFGNWVQVLRSKEVDKIAIKYLKIECKCFSP
jgi:hypothetical protein